MANQNKDKYHKVNTCKQSQTRENASDHVAIGFGFASYWLSTWHEFSRPITERIKAKPMQSRITFDTQFQIALKGRNPILRVRWPVIFSNQNLWERTKTQPVGEDILQKRWRWIGHTLQKPTSSTTRRALTWNPQEKRKRGFPRNTWRRDRTLRKIQGGWERLGGSLNDWPRIEMPGEDLLVAYVLYRTTGGK